MGKFDWLKPKPPKPPVAVIPTITISVKDNAGNPISGARAEAIGINWGFTESNGELTRANHNPTITSTHIIVEKDGYFKYDEVWSVTPNVNNIFRVQITEKPIIIEPTIPKAPSVKINGIHFNLDNKLGRIQEVSNFKGLRHFIDDRNKQIEFLKVFRELGYNTVRVFINLEWGRISAKEEPNYYQKVEDFFDFTFDQGFIVECGILQDCVGLGITREEGQEIVKRVTDIGSLFSHVIFHNNEPGKNLPANSSPNDFSGFVNSNVIYSHGSRISVDDVIKPPQDYIDEHTNRDNEWWRRGKDIKDISDIYGVPVLMNEPMGADNVPKPGSRSNIPREFLIYSAFSSLFGGSCFHSTKTAFSEIPDGTELECAREFAKGFNSIDPEWMLGDYSALHLNGPVLLENGKVERGYFKIKGNSAIGAVSTGIPGRPSGYNIGNGWQLDKQINDVVMTFKR